MKTKTSSESSFKFVYAADLQPGTPRSFRYRAAWRENWLTARQQIIDAQPEFMVIGGDLTRDGFYHDFEFEEMKMSLDAMNIPWHVIPGNMDVGNKRSDIHGAIPSRDDSLLNISSERLSAFERFFGPSNWTFTHGNLRISGFCDMLLGSGLPEEKKLRKFLTDLALLPPVEHHFVLTHYALFIQDPEEADYDITVKEQYFDWYFTVNKADRKFLLDCFKKAGVTRVQTAHIHCRREVVYDNIVFDFAPSTTFGQYGDKWPDGDNTPGFYLFKINGKQVFKDFIPTAPLSSNEDAFGQGGHVTRDHIDYSESKAYLKKLFS
ncbi:MAG: metallophosphoesterase [Victivallaceae bacterium]|nr:metallophosphoesterase [Victivallaceae bacterium]